MVIKDTLPLGCMGNKSRELKLLLPIIEQHITEDTIFVEPFCGSCVVSFNVHKKHGSKIHINDIDEIRIQFYNNMKDKNKREEFYKLQDECIKPDGDKYYYEILGKNKCKMKTDYNAYIISRTISAFRYGLYPTTKKPNKKIISENWINYFNNATITNEDYKKILDKYKDNENAFIYLDPPYMDSFNAGYNAYSGKSYDEDMTIKDNTEMYINLLDVLKCKCKVLFSINDCAITRYLYKDYIKNNYKHIYATSHLKLKNINEGKTNKKTNVLIISNF